MIDELRKVISIVSQYDQLSVQTILLTMLVATLCGFVIFFVYRFFYSGIVYSHNFGMLIILVCVITSFVIVTLGANLVLSLGMVGALSIVRFRAAIKEPLDIGFIYWSIAVGLAAGARLYLVALIATAIVAGIYVLLTYMRKEKRNFLLIMNYDSENDDDVKEILRKTIRYKLKNKAYTGDDIELTVEIEVKKNNTRFMNAFTGEEFIRSAILVEYTGDYT